jgi:ornithine carbamoyltransferase
MALPIAPSAALVGPALARMAGSQGSVLERARGLWQASRSGTCTKALKNKNIGLVCAQTDDQEASLLRQAAGDLGAHVSDVRPSLSDESSPADFAATARMLGKLYDAVILHGQPHSVVSRLADLSAVPVLDSIASPTHPTAVLATEVDASLSPADARRFVLEAVLLGVLT